MSYEMKVNGRELEMSEEENLENMNDENDI